MRIDFVHRDEGDKTNNCIGMTPAYKATDLNDDDYNFVSGMNYVESEVLDCWYSNEFCVIQTTEEKMKAEHAKEIIEELKDWISCEISEVITSALDNYPEEEK